RPERRLLVGPEVAYRLAEADQPLLDQVLALTAGDEVRAGLHPHETGVPLDEFVAGAIVAVAHTHNELQILEFTLRPLLRPDCCGCCRASGHGSLLQFGAESGSTRQVSPSG